MMAVSDLFFIILIGGVASSNGVSIGAQVVNDASDTSSLDSDYDPIILPGNKQPGVPHLILFVPGGKVPPENYTAYVSSVMGKSKTNLFGAIVRCGKLNLCDPLGQLDSLMAAAIKAAEAASKFNFDTKNIFVIGHSLGGTGARHYVDVATPQGPASFAGLALLGTQYNGDHEDFKGTLGYPMHLASFGAPLLALLGELDALPISHAAVLYQQYALLSPADQAKKPVVIVPGMDHSQFCSPFHVSNDLKPEISDAQAINITSTVTADWIDALVLPSQMEQMGDLQAAVRLREYVASTTASISAPFLAAQKYEATKVCEIAQLELLTKLPVAALDKVRIAITLTPNGSLPLEHTHTNVTVSANGTVELTISSYPFYPAVSSYNPINRFAPTYTAANDISCKMVSADKVAQTLNVTGQFPQTLPPVGCDAINRELFNTAMSLVTLNWPSAAERFKRRGRGAMTFANDTSITIGPQWVFLSNLKYDDSSKVQGPTVTSPRLYSSITSKIYPGNIYCKVISPAKAVEYIQTMGLTQRYA